jgi:hypothetical protein
VLMLAREEEQVLAAAGHGSRATRRGSASAGPQLVLRPGDVGVDVRECLDIPQVKTRAETAGTVLDGMTCLQHSRGWPGTVAVAAAAAAQARE